MPLVTAFETLLATNYNSFFLTVGIFGVGICSIEGGRYIKYLTLVQEMCMVTAVIVKGHMYYQKYHPCIHQYNISRVYRNEDIYELESVHIANFEVGLFLSSIEYCSISNVNSYQCSCKQCCALAVYAMCYSVINPCGYWTQELYLPLSSYRNILYNVMGVKRHIAGRSSSKCQYQYC